MDYKDISPELREKAKGLSGDELLKLAKDEGVELSDTQLEQIAGGASGWGESAICPACGSGNTYYDKMLDVHVCNRCNEQF